MSWRRRPVSNTRLFWRPGRMLVAMKEPLWRPDWWSVAKTELLVDRDMMQLMLSGLVKHTNWWMLQLRTVQLQQVIAAQEMGITAKQGFAVAQEPWIGALQEHQFSTFTMYHCSTGGWSFTNWKIVVRSQTLKCGTLHRIVCTLYCSLCHLCMMCDCGIYEVVK